MTKRKLVIFGLMVMVVILATACNGQFTCGSGTSINEGRAGQSVCGSGDLITESRPIGNFDRVDISASGELTIIQSGEESLIIETDDNIMPFVTSEVRGSTLFLGIEFHSQVSSISPTRIRYTLNVISLQGVSISGSAGIVAEELNADRMDFDIGGSGELRVNKLIVNELILNIGGSAGVELAGEVSSQLVIVSGSSEYHARDLRSEIVNLTVSGVARATVWATETLNAVVSGLAEVRYYGNPQTLFSVSSTAEIHSLGDR